MNKSKEITVAIYTVKSTELIRKVDPWLENNANYVRITEPVTVTFESRKHDDVLCDRIACLDEEIKDVRAEAQAKVNDLEDQKQRLMALTHEADDE